MSELKRVPFSTFTTTNNGGGGGSIIGAVEGISSNSRRNNNFGPGVATILQIHHTENGSSSSSSAAMPPPSVPSSSAGLSSISVAAAATAPSEPMTSRQQNSKTIRLELQLFEPDSGSSPEFNYLELIKIEKKKIKKLSRINGFVDPFEENDDEVARIAKEFEKKYGGGTVGSGKRRSKKDDLCDKGAGYDESDSFIDNTEAYDEIIPDEVETVEGGFYINSGALEFKHLSNYERAEDVIKMVKSKKRALSSSSSSDDEIESNQSEDENEGNSLLKENTTVNTALKLKNGHMDKKHKNGDTSDKESNASVKSSKHKDKKPDKLKVKDDLKVDEMLVDPIKEKDKEKTVKTTTVKDMLKAKRDNFRKMREGESKVKVMNGESVKSSASNDSSDSSGDESGSCDEPTEKKIRKSGEEDPEKTRATDVKLPDNLNEEILKDIEELKEVGKSQGPFSKGVQFDERIIEIFLRIDDACLCLDKVTRNTVFAHIEYQLSVSKYYLLRKAKQLRIKHEKSKTKKAFMKLRKAVAEVMPSILLQYEISCKKIDEIKSCLSPAELEQMEHPPKYPKKKFPWKDNLRNLLYDLYQIRWMSYTVLRTKKQGFEEFVNNYLREKVISIWPSGWMKYEDLKRELEKRKLTAKKTKENKKPIDLASTHKKFDSASNNFSITKSPSQSVDLTKSVLSSCNSLSVVSTKDLVVTIAAKSSEKSTSSVANMSNKNAQSNSIKQVPPESINPQSKCSASSGISKPQQDGLYAPSHHKSYKLSSSSSSSSGDSKSPSPLHLEYCTVSSKPGSQNVGSSNYSKNGGSSGKLNGGSSGKLNADKSNGNSNNSISTNSGVNSQHKLPATAISGKGSLDLVSPTKRSTDHSINSIMSSPTSNLPNTTVSPTGAKGNKDSGESPTTHVINIDNLKNATEIINTTNQLLSGSGISNANIEGPFLKKEGSIRIKSFANVSSNSELERTNESSNAGYKSEHDSSSESDGVEIVGVYSAVTRKKQNISSNQNKLKKSRCGSPLSVPIDLGTYAKLGLGNSASQVAKLSENSKDPELDVNQIMKALKELEEMQQSSVHVSPANTSGNNSTHTYDKDAKQ